MALSSAALWLNSFFSGFDGALLSFQHTMAEAAGGILTPLMKLITLLGEKGIIFFLLALVFMCFSRTRPLGVCIFGAVCCGALITNVILKDAIARPRPFESVELYKQWWTALGSPAEDGFSFPSGHVTAAAAGMTAITMMKGKRWILPSALVVLFMCIARNYLMAHYPSDVLAAAFIGLISGMVAWVITRLIFDFLEDRRGTPIFDLMLDFDLPLRLPELGGGRGGQRKSSGSRGGAYSGGHAQRGSGGYDDEAPRRGGGAYRGKHER